MLLFLDCEFTDFLDIDLISIALVSDTGRHEFYAERTDFRREACSEFVRAAVLPLLGQVSGAGCDREELRTRLWAFFASLPGEVQLATDSRHDLDLLGDALGEGWPPNLARSVLDLREQLGHPAYDLAVGRYHAQPGRPWHHALHDAHANRAGWKAWKKLNNRAGHA